MMLNYVGELVIYFLFSIELVVSSAASPATCEESGVTNNFDGTSTLRIRFPHVTTRKNDKYVCNQFSGFDPDKDSYILKYMPKASQENIHHMMLYGCSTEPTSQVWECGMGSICPDGSKMKIMYAWARDAQQLQLPRDVGFKIGKDARISSLVLQIHYAHPIQSDCSGLSLLITHQPQMYSAGIYLLGSSGIFIPPHDTATAMATCRHHFRQPLQVFAFRTHTHNLGVRVVGYRRRNGKTKVIGSGNPLWPQAFYPRVGGSIDLHDNDLLLARCDYKSDRNVTTRAGMTGDDEMCNFYMMYYTMTSPTSGQEDLSCWNDQLSDDVTFPDDRATPPFPGYAGLDSIMSIVRGDAERPPVPEVMHHHHSHPVESEKDDVTAQDVPTDKKTHEATVRWPADPSLDLGQIGGVDVDDRTGLVHIFQRGSRTWNANSFLPGNIFSQQDDPISTNVVDVVDSDVGMLMYSWGANQFFMPHGITVVGDTVWMTDVALHQAFKYPIKGAAAPLMTLGQRFQPGSDQHHFCKPTSVAVDPQGYIYVADGYCNSRVVRFNADGAYVSAWGKPTVVGSMAPPGGCMSVVHDIKYVPLDGAVCVADRENGRVQCFNRESGRLRAMYENREVIGDKIYAIDFATDGKDGRLYMVDNNWPGASTSSGFTVDYRSGQVLDRWSRGVGGHQLRSPHALAVSTDRRHAFVGQIEGKSMVKVELVERDRKLGESLVRDDDFPDAGEGRLLGDDNVVVDDGGDVTYLQAPVAEKLVGGKVTNDDDDDSNDGDSKKKATSVTSKNVLVLLLLTILPLIAIVLSIFYFISRNRQMKDYKRLMFEDEDWVNDEENGGGGGKLNIGKMLPKRNNVPKHKLLKPKNGEDEGLMNGVDDED